MCTSSIICYQVIQIYINPLKTKRRPLYLKAQSVPRCKHFSSRFLAECSFCYGNPIFIYYLYLSQSCTIYPVYKYSILFSIILCTAVFLFTILPLLPLLIFSQLLPLDFFFWYFVLYNTCLEFINFIILVQLLIISFVLCLHVLLLHPLTFMLRGDYKCMETHLYSPYSLQVVMLN